jgi:hypothetical protein
MADLSREQLAELSKTPHDLDFAQVRMMRSTLRSLISMALRCLAHEEALSADRAEEIASDLEQGALWDSHHLDLRAYVAACREGK